MGKNYDWTHNDGMLVVNKKNLKKTALAAKPAQWVSRYGSVTFNQHGRELPLGGINEAGLAVEVMWLDDSSHPPAGQVPQVNELQWIQYQLDNYSSAAELAANADKIVVAKVFAPVHYLACDKTGECASIEYISRKLRVRVGKDLFVNTMANDTYNSSTAFLRNFKGFGGDRDIPSGEDSLSRFVRASSLAKNYVQQNPAEEYAFGILQSVHQTDPEKATQWSIVYSLAAGHVAFRSQGDYKLQTLAISAFDYSCSQPVKTLELNQGWSGDVSGNFIPYTRALNRKVVERGLKDTGAELPPELIDEIAAYPESAICLENPPLNLSYKVSVDESFVEGL